LLLLFQWVSHARDNAQVVSDCRRRHSRPFRGNPTTIPEQPQGKSRFSFGGR
jgi:hypothetical protein